ncbi:MAG: TIM barrel protein [Planctomyces sp.]|nr:TIM barrel protein [Planctomyces sp.]
MNPEMAGRRAVLHGLALGTIGTLTPSVVAQSATTGEEGDDLSNFRIKNGRIRQSVMGWCFQPMPVPELIDHVQAIGIEGIEGIPAEFYPLAVEKGLKISLVSSHGFAKGPVDPRNHEEVIATLRSSIDTAVRFECSSVITFTGMRVDGMTDQEGEDNCVDAWKKVIGYAEDKGVTLVLEHLNTRDDTHPMKGHPGYFGDQLDRCARLIERVNSPCFRLLFDIYHVQIMHGDVIRRIRSMHSMIGHYHTAGNPGRCEIDEHQEINYPAIMKVILETGYKGYVAQEFIPTWSDPVLSLRHGARTCDV